MNLGPWIVTMVRLMIVFLVWIPFSWLVHADGILQIQLHGEVISAIRQMNKTQSEASDVIPKFYATELCISGGPFTNLDNNCTLGHNTFNFSQSNPDFNLTLNFSFHGKFPIRCYIVLRILKLSKDEDGLQRMVTLTQTSWSEELKSTPHVLKDAPKEQYKAIHLSTSSLIVIYKFGYILTCASDFYGPLCETFCRPVRGIHGNYVCDGESGKKICQTGWIGERCDKAVCENDCVHGRCLSPNKCICDMGWYGLSCNQCRVYPGCQHGECKWNESAGSPVPYTCDCLTGWGGVLCDVALPTCETPPGRCQNGGRCVVIENTRSCLCLTGFAGEQCEQVIQDCRITGCHSAGYCIRSATGNYTCKCFEGYKGETCQIRQENTSTLKPCAMAFRNFDDCKSQCRYDCFIHQDTAYCEENECDENSKNHTTNPQLESNEKTVNEQRNGVQSIYKQAVAVLLCGYIVISLVIILSRLSRSYNVRQTKPRDIHSRGIQQSNHDSLHSKLYLSDMFKKEYWLRREANNTTDNIHLLPNC